MYLKKLWLKIPKPKRRKQVIQMKQKQSTEDPKEYEPKQGLCQDIIKMAKVKIRRG